METLASIWEIKILIADYKNEKADAGYAGRWAHRLAVLLASATLLTILVAGTVTTRRRGF